MSAAGHYRTPAPHHQEGPASHFGPRRKEGSGRSRSPFLVEFATLLVTDPLRPEDHTPARRHDPLPDQTAFSAVGIVAVPPIRIAPAVTGSDPKAERTNPNACAPGISTQINLRGRRNSRSECDGRCRGEKKFLHDTPPFHVAWRHRINVCVRVRVLFLKRFLFLGTNAHTKV